MTKLRTHETKQMGFRLRLNLMGWLKWQNSKYGGISAYLNELLEADREAHMADSESSDDYRTYLKLYGYDEARRGAGHRLPVRPAAHVARDRQARVTAR